MLDVTAEESTSPRRYLRAHLRACAAAFTFLTRIPVHRLVAHDGEDLRHAATYFPLVGLVVGAAGGAVFAAAARVWPTPLAVILSVAATVWMTGAFHEDALADAFDGFGGGWDRAQILAIMKDSRIGSYALVGVALVLGAKLSALMTLGGAFDDRTRGVGQVVRALIVGHVLARWSSLPLIWRYPYVRPTDVGERPSAGRPLAGAVTVLQLFAATTFALVVTALTLGRRALPVVAGAVLVTWLAGRYFERRLAGITGDALGAANQMVELSVYLTLAALR
jgi:adenosylcobinamide-GDP ribazoletransferase